MFATRLHRRQPARPDRRRKQPGRRQALELLAACPDGCTEALLLANGFTVELLIELIRAELATATAERRVAADKMIELARVRITEAGRRALVEKARDWK